MPSPQNWIKNPAGVSRPLSGLRPLYRLNRLHGTTAIKAQTLPADSPWDLRLFFAFGDGSTASVLYASAEVFVDRIADGRAFAEVPIFLNGEPAPFQKVKGFSVVVIRPGAGGREDRVELGPFATWGEAMRAALFVAPGAVPIGQAGRDRFLTNAIRTRRGFLREVPTVKAYAVKAWWNDAREDGGTYATRYKADAVARDYRAAGYSALSAPVFLSDAEAQAEGIE